MKSFPTTRTMITTLFLLLFSASIHADEQVLKIETARIAGPYQLTAPIQMDSIDKQGKKFDPESFLNINKPQQNRLFALPTTSLQAYAAPLPYIKDETSLLYLSFNMTPNQFVSGKLEIKGIKNYKVFLDEAPAPDKLTLTPTAHRITIACLPSKEGKDSFNVAFKYKNGNIVVNSTEKRPYTLHDITDGIRYSGISVSPSGKYALIRYTNTNAEGKSDTYSQLVEVETNRILLPEVGTGHRWLPQRDAFYYMKNQQDGRYSIRIMEIPSFNETVLASDMPELKGWTLSPNLKYVVYTTDDDSKENPDLKLFNMPDDRLYNSLTHSFLNIYDLESGISRPLTFGKTTTRLADISNDGNRLLFTTSTMVLNRFPFDKSSLYLYDFDKGQLTQLLNDTIGIDECSFSPDGQKLLIQATAEAFAGIGKTVPANVITNIFEKQLFLFDINTRQVTPLTRDFNPSISSAVWSNKDGNIYLLANDESRSSLYQLSLKNHSIQKIATPISYISRFSLANEGMTLAYYGEGPTYARKMYRIYLSDKKWKSTPLGTIDFDSNMKDVEIPEFNYWSFRASRGDTIKGFYYLPPKIDPTRKYPMIVYYYGGCTPTAERLEINYPFAVWASQGYVVYVVQPSGALGFGQEFGSRHVNTWGKESGDDILEGTHQFIKEHAFVNEKRVACIGASYGGFMTEYLLTKTDFFRTAIAHAGISDITAYWGGGNWGYTYSEVAGAKSFPWNNREMYVDHSPLYNADKIVTPLLLIQGSEDDNVPNNQAWQLYTALRILGRTTEFIQVKGENHVIRDYKKQKQWQTAICAWFARWLKDEPEWWDELYPPKK